MWNEEKIVNFIKKNLNEKRFMHSMGVSEVAVKLAKVYGEDVFKAKMAGLVHDCAKYMSGQQILDIMRECGEEIDIVSQKNPEIMHGFAGAYIAKNIMKINDQYILDAVTYHTTGRQNMTMLDKITYIADYIEPSRNFRGVNILRREAYNNIDKALIMAFDNTIRFVISKGELLHSRTIEARNYLICQK